MHSWLFRNRGKLAHSGCNLSDAIKQDDLLDHTLHTEQCKVVHQGSAVVDDAEHTQTHTDTLNRLTLEGARFPDQSWAG